MTLARMCATAEDTQRAGVEFAALLQVGDIVLLDGPLGAGKTTFTQGVARGLGVHERVTSPTFTVVRQHACTAHPTLRTLHHADVYRINHLDEVVDLALAELVEEDGVALVEWGTLASSVFGDDVITVTFAIDDETRRLELSGPALARRMSAAEQWVHA